MATTICLHWTFKYQVVGNDVGWHFDYGSKLAGGRLREEHRSSGEGNEMKRSYVFYLSEHCSS